jgi:predicted DNA-binding transcriptional regulator YafY
MLALCEVDGEETKKPARIGQSVLTILYSLQFGKNVRITYHESGEREVTTTVAPYRLLLANGAWQLVGRSTLHRGTVRLAVEDIRQATPVDTSDLGFTIESPRSSDNGPV